MKPRIRKELIKLFRREFERKFPRFSWVKGAGDPTWSLSLAPNLTLFVMFPPFERCAGFVIELAWNDRNEFPWNGPGDFSNVGSPRLRSRLGWLWAPGNSEPIWDLAPERKEADLARHEARRRGNPALYPPDPPIEKILSRVEPAVNDAINKLVEYGMPVFGKVAENRGIPWQLD